MSRAELEHLYKGVLPAVRHALEEHAAFEPFGAGLGVDGKVKRIEPRSLPTDGGAAARVVAIHGAVQTAAEELEFRAVAVCTEITLEPDDVGDAPDGIRIHLEHSVGECLDVLLPFRRESDGSVEYGELAAQEAERKIIPLAS